jgi:hypothetical protein
MSDLFFKDDKSGWTRIILPLSVSNFARLNHDISGVPIYHCEGQLWPKPVAGITVIWPEEGGDKHG